MFLTGKFGAAARGRDPGDDFWYSEVGLSTTAGVPVTEDNAMRTSAVFACVRVLAESVAQLPLILYERSGKGKERASTHPLYPIMRRSPNDQQTSYEFREMMQGHLALRGNAYALIEWTGSGRVGALVPQHPDRVEVEALPSGRIRYRVKTPETVTSAQQVRNYTSDEVFHLRGLSSDGVMGLSPITMARESVGMALAAEDYGARFFKNDARPRGVIQHPSHFKDQEAAKRFKKGWQKAHGGANRHKTAVLEDGMTYANIGMSNEDAQFIDVRKYQVNDLARIFRVPPHMIGDLERATFTNIEHQGLEFVIHTLGPWLVRWEQAIGRDLIRRPDQYFVEHLVDGLLRGDIETRYKAYAVAVTNGWLTRNEVRRMENMNPLDGLDEPLTPMNMQQGRRATDNQAAERIAQREESELRAAFDPDHVGRFLSATREIYSGLSAEIQEAFDLSETAAMSYCETGRAAIKTSSDIARTLDGLAESRAVELENLVRTHS